MIVVAAALVRGGLVLVGQRVRPVELAGRWELPGGRVETGESEASAVVRECREELGVDVRVAQRLGPDVPIRDGLVLRVHVAELARDSPEPVALEHAALCWLGPDDLTGVDWADADRAVLPELDALLRSRS